MNMSEAREIARRTGKSYQQILLEATGKEFHVTMVPAVRKFVKNILGVSNEEWARVTEQAKRQRDEIDAAEKRRAEEAARIAAEVAAEIFPWERH